MTFSPQPEARRISKTALVVISIPPLLLFWWWSGLGAQVTGLEDPPHIIIQHKNGTETHLSCKNTGSGVITCLPGDLILTHHAS